MTLTYRKPEVRPEESRGGKSFALTYLRGADGPPSDQGLIREDPKPPLGGVSFLPGVGVLSWLAGVSSRCSNSSCSHMEDSVRMTAYQPIQRKFCERSSVFWVPSPHVRTVSEEARGLQRSRVIPSPCASPLSKPMASTALPSSLPLVVLASLPTLMTGMRHIWCWKGS